MQSTQQPDSSLINQLTLLMKQVKANYPAMEISAETAIVWLDQWADIVRDYNLHLFTRALKQCLRVKLFLPLPADIEQTLKSIAQEDAQQHEDTDKWIPCGECGTGGHVIVQKDGVQVAVRCECWNAWKRRHG